MATTGSAKQPVQDSSKAPRVTRALAQNASALRYDDLSPEARTIVGHCMLDWFGAYCMPKNNARNSRAS